MTDRMMLPHGYKYDENGFLKQTEHTTFPYTIEYKSRQGTNVEMSYLRLGWISSFFRSEEISKMNVVDIGCGNGVFVRCSSGKFGRIVGYDVVGDSISKDELYNTVWDMIILSDVLEHFDDIEDLFKIKWKFCMLSFPETPDVGTFEELRKWRHFKPNEHLYYLTAPKVRKWLESHIGVKVIGISNFEDLIRKRWDSSKTNISSIMTKRMLYEERTVCNNSVS